MIPKRKGAIYCRVSTDEQEQNGSSLEYQRETNIKYSQTQNISVKEEYIFMEQYSGGFFNRPLLNILLKLVKNKEIDCIIFTKRDRIARSQLVYQKIKQVCEDNNVEILLSIETTTGDKAMDNFIGSTFVQFAEWEREQIKQRTYAGKRQYAKNNKWILSHIPYGYRKNPVLKELELYENEAKVVKKIFEYFLEKRLTMGAIAKKLTEENTLCPSASLNIKKGGNALDKLENKKNSIYYWNMSNIHKILSRAVMYSGEYQAFKKQYKMIGDKTIFLQERAKEEWITLRIPAIITKKQAIQTQEQLTKNRNFAKKRSKRNYMLQGKLFCDCEKPELHNFVGYFHNVKGLRNYRCSLHNTSRVSKERKCSNHISGLKIEAIVIETLKEILTDPEYIFEKALNDFLGENKEKSDKNRYNELYGNILEIEEKHKRNEELFIDGLINKERFLEIKNELEAKKGVLEKEFSKEHEIMKNEIFKEQAKKNILEIIEYKQKIIENFFEYAKYDDYKEMVDLLIDKIIVPFDKSKEIQIILKIPGNIPSFQEKYFEEEYVEYTDESGKNHYICQTGQIIPKKLKLDSTKGYEFRSIRFTEKGDENEFFGSKGNILLDYLKEKVNLFCGGDHYTN